MFLNPQTHREMKPGNNDIAYNSRLGSTHFLKNISTKQKMGTYSQAKNFLSCVTSTVLHKTFQNFRISEANNKTHGKINKF